MIPRSVYLTLSLLFWGHWSNMLLIAVIFSAVVIIGPRTSFRLQLEDRQFNRVVDLTTVIFAGVGLYLIINTGRNGLFTLLAWAPVILFPLLLSQLFSMAGTISLTSLLLAMRPQQASKTGSGRRVDISWSYMALCVLAASTQVNNHPWFYPMLLLMFLVALFSVRSQRHHWIAWLSVIAIAGTVGYVGQVGLKQLHNEVENIGLALLQDWFSQERDISHTNTAIGYVGELKASSRIVWQLRTNNPDTVPKLLRQASYQHYVFGSWQAPKSSMTLLRQAQDPERWWVTTGTETESHLIRLTGDLGNGVLPVPMGVYQIDGLPAAAVEQSPLGAIIAEDAPEFADFTLRYTNQATDSEPGDVDSEVPQALRPTLQQLVEELQLHPGQPHVNLAKIKRFFKDDFAYSLYLRGPENDRIPLRTFLLKERKGHCEYFASAGVLLLRAAGIPARYAGGYAINEYSPVTDSWLIRKRHAHAWVLAYVDGKWVDLDYTPSTWADMEQQTAPWWVGIIDLWTLFHHSLNSRDTEATSSTFKTWPLLIILFVIAAYWVYRHKHGLAGQPSRAPSATKHRQGNDSPFYQLQQKLEAEGYGPHKNETLRQWLARLESMKSHGLDLAPLALILALHYQYRFGPAGELASLKSELQIKVRQWMDQHPTATT